jgi:Rrf2 family protein
LLLALPRKKEVAQVKLSTRARYALKSMIAIARLSNANDPVSLGKVAEATGISRRYLEQLAVAQRNASLLRAVGGREGGYMLARPAEEITVGQIVEAGIGPINIVECADEPERCAQSEDCECRMIFLLMNLRLKEVLGKYCLADLADRSRLGRIKEELFRTLETAGSGGRADDV